MTEQGPNITDPDARACLAAASAATTAIDLLLCAVRDGEAPNREEIVTALADAVNVFLRRYPGDDMETETLHGAACDFLGLDRPEPRHG
ncbi:hypothetical protein [Methylobacterium dankookense]|uniref:Uncharacterized protein n=1 Tax=Methylobacterium dankookense TaxID=560405 RepID=A0A564G441_9HYPH|nr:hypothetical protein [Methylobacterium dankookense]GJD59809.1 hypothetical protein IFDJLNFL_5740 [Methylobacterium dankookense]VUF15067.1 hypothetical protein MTDSW087_04800 [Methylobacterium dankookense]